MSDKMRANWDDADDSAEALSLGKPSEEPQSPSNDVWNKSKMLFEFEEVDGVRYRITKQVREYKVTRPFCMADQRAKWKPFGDAANPALQKDLVQHDPVVVLELGAADPLEKQCRDEVTRMWGDVERMSVTVKDPNLARFAVAAQQVKAAAAPAPVAAASPTDDGTKKTWGQANKEKKEGATTAEPTKEGGDKLAKNVVRISNLSDFISEVELRRLFGTDNNLPAIQRLFIAVDKETGQRRGFAYITYKSDADGVKVVDKMNPTKFKNTVMKVDFGTNRKP